MAGLRWKDIDLDNGKLKVSNVLHHMSVIGLHTATPKTEQSRRTLSLASEVVDLLHSVGATK